jgi:hypothetical protein
MRKKEAGEANQSDALSDPWAMMIESVYTIVAYRTM